MFQYHALALCDAVLKPATDGRSEGCHLKFRFFRLIIEGLGFRGLGKWLHQEEGCAYLTLHEDHLQALCKLEVCVPMIPVLSSVDPVAHQIFLEEDMNFRHDLSSHARHFFLRKLLVFFWHR